MLDYYGSILFEEDDIKKDIMNYYKQLNQGRIQECFQELKEEGHILKQYSAYLDGMYSIGKRLYKKYMTSIK